MASSYHTRRVGRAHGTIHDCISAPDNTLKEFCPQLFLEQTNDLPGGWVDINVLRGRFRR
jgi:tellurite resistance-related uncharacterized protein